MTNRHEREAKLMALLPIALVVVGIFVGLVAPHWFGSIGRVSAQPVLTAQQETLLSEFRSCLKAIPEKVTARFTSSCAEKDAGLLRGISRTALNSRLGHPDWCRSTGKAEFILWLEGACGSSPIWGYSFYRIPALGGGPELQITFDDKQSSRDVSWVHTQ